MQSCWSELIRLITTVSCTQHLQIHRLLLCATYVFPLRQGRVKTIKTAGDERGWAAARYSSCQAGTESEECVGTKVKSSRANRRWVVLLGCQCVVWFGPTLFTARSLNRWRPVSWWFWVGAGEGSCWAKEVVCAFDVAGAVGALWDLSSLDYRTGSRNLPCCFSQAAGAGLHPCQSSPSR